VHQAHVASGPLCCRQPAAGEDGGHHRRWTHRERLRSHDGRGPQGKHHLPRVNSIAAHTLSHLRIQVTHNGAFNHTAKGQVRMMQACP